MPPESPVPAMAPLPEDAILVHLGPHKTGTTSMQSTFARLRTELAEHDILYPGSKTAHHREARALIQRRSGWEHDSTDPPPMRIWSRLAHRATSFAGRVVISSELFSDATEAECGELVHALGPERVHVIAAARNPAGIAVSNWQQVVRTFGRSEDLEDYLEVDFRRDGTTGPQSRFWHRVDTTALVTRWLAFLPPERITVVVLDEGDRLLLPSTFEQLLGLPAGSLVDQESGTVNRGLSALELSFIRRVNALLQDQLSWAEYTRMMRGGVLPRVLASRDPGPDEGRVPLPQWAVDQAAVEAERNIAGLQASGVRIAGDLPALRRAPVQPAEGAPITDVPLDLAADAVLGAITAGVLKIRSLEATRPARRRTAASRPTTSEPARRTRRAARSAAPVSPSIDDVGTRELAAALARRIRARLTRTDR